MTRIALVILLIVKVNCFEPFTTGIGIGSGLGLAGLYASYGHLKSYFFESCDPNWINLNVTGLQSDLERQLHGQHLVREVVLKAIKAHIKKVRADKPLVMSFHGWTGGGKNFVSKIIVDNIYKEQQKSKFVHWFISTVHFPHQSEVERYKDELQRWIMGNVSQCAVCTFIFDEVDKLPIGLLDAIKPFVDYYDTIGGTDFRRSIFILLSNTGGTDITERMLQFWHDGVNREDITYADLENLIHHGAFNEKGGLYRTSMIDRNLIDYYIPFLPLERSHIKLCIRDEIIKRGLEVNEKLIDQIADEMPYYPDEYKIYSRVGCKRVAQKVDYYLS